MRELLMQHLTGARPLCHFVTSPHTVGSHPDGRLACNDKDIGKPNGSESWIYLRSAANNPIALLTAYSDYQKC